MRGWARVAGWILVAGLRGGCSLQAHDPCGSDLVVDGEGHCVCPAGTVPAGQTSACVPCGANQVAAGGRCACAPGFARAGDGPCTNAGLGAPCDAERPCLDTAAGSCHVTAGAAGYCTRSGCAAADTCGAGFVCETRGSPSYCRRAPVGQGKTCATAADCAGGEATYCEFFSLKQCLVEGCVPAANDCFPGSTCCNLAALGLAKTLCLPGTQCP